MANNERTSQLIEYFQQVRALSIKICEPLETEDYIIQSMPDVSPPKWHLAHTTWFFEAFLLSKFKTNFKTFDPQFNFIFNSYYKSLGDHLHRPSRGFLSRPSISVVQNYRASVDQEVFEFLKNECTTFSENELSEIEKIIILGLNHEQQHQELLITDIKHILCTNPTYPSYFKEKIEPSKNKKNNEARWINFKKGIYSIGFNGKSFSYDNEGPSHDVYLESFQISSLLVTNGEYIEFIEAGCYQKPEYWLSLGWDTIQNEKWTSPLYWQKIDNQWHSATLAGLKKIEIDEPVCHVSYFEADAYARWKKARLLTEAEWEVAALSLESTSGNFLELKSLSPKIALNNSGLEQMYGDVWQWTSSAYSPYPGFKPFDGPASEYNGKFMCNQMVLRGGSCATPKGHVRASYRNFFPPHSRWQFMGIRLARGQND